MGQPIVIHLPTAENASALARALAMQFGERVSVAETRVVIGFERPADRLVTAVLDAVRTWLCTSNVASVEIRIDGHDYTLAAEPEPRRSKARA